eukprot:194641-Pelagomonas_calceolata.AAC.1
MRCMWSCPLPLHITWAWCGGHCFHPTEVKAPPACGVQQSRCNPVTPSHPCSCPKMCLRDSVSDHTAHRDVGASVFGYGRKRGTISGIRVRLCIAYHHVYGCFCGGARACYNFMVLQPVLCNGT